MTLPRADHRALPVEPEIEDETENERRYRAEMERVTTVYDEAMRQAENRLAALELFIQTGVTYGYVVTDDAGDGTAVDDINNTDFTGQEGAVGACAQAVPGVGISFYHKGVQYAYVGPRPASYGIGCADTITGDDIISTGVGDHGALSGLSDDDHPQYHNDARGDVRYYTKPVIDAHTGNLNNPHQTSWGNLLSKPATFPPSPHTHVEADITDLNRTRWVAPYTPGQAALRNDMVYDDTWLVIANKDTSARAAPQPSGDRQYDLPDAPAWALSSYNGVVRSGREWDIVTPVGLYGYDVWVPTLTPDTEYVIFEYSYPTASPGDIRFQQVSEPLLVENAWTTVQATFSLIPAGITIGLFIDALNSGSSTLVTGGWARAADNNNVTTDPGAGGWGTANNNASLRVNFTDLDSTDRTTEVMGMIAGTTVTFSDTTDPNRSVTYALTTAPTNQGTHASWTAQVSDTGPSGAPAVGATTTMNATVPVPSPTDYVLLGGGNPGPNTRGTLELDGVPQAGAEANAYGVRILWDEYIKSDDWDIMAYSAGSVGGDSGASGSASAERELKKLQARVAELEALVLP